MARGGHETDQAKQNAQTLFNNSQDVYHTSAGNSGKLFNTLFPTYSDMASGVDTPGSIAENTAGQQSTGGGLSSLMGQLGLTAARTHNSGGITAAADEGSREAMRRNSENAVKIKANNVNEGLAGENSLYNSNTHDMLASLGIGDQATNTNIDAVKTQSEIDQANSPFNKFMSVWKNAIESAKAAAQFAHGGGSGGSDAMGSNGNA